MATGGAATVCDGGLELTAGLEARAVVVSLPASPAPPTGTMTAALVVAAWAAGDAACVAGALGVVVGEAFFLTTVFLLALTLAVLGEADGEWLATTTTCVVAGAAVVTGADVGTAVVTVAVVVGAGVQLGDGVGLGVEESETDGVGVRVGIGGREIVGRPVSDTVGDAVGVEESEGDAQPGSS